MDGDDGTLSRRALLRGGVAAAATVALTGCAALPDLVRRGGFHPCEARFCRYWLPPRAGASMGSCTLPVRATGGP